MEPQARRSYADVRRRRRKINFFPSERESPFSKWTKRLFDRLRCVMREIARLFLLLSAISLVSCAAVGGACPSRPVHAPMWSPNWEDLEQLALPGKGCAMSQYRIFNNSRVRVKDKKFFVLGEAMGSGIAFGIVHIYQCSEGMGCNLAASRSSMQYPLRWQVDENEENFLIRNNEGDTVLVLPIDSMRLTY